MSPHIFRAPWMTETPPAWPLTETPDLPVVERYPALTLRAFATKQALVQDRLALYSQFCFQHTVIPQLLSAFAPSRLPFPATLWHAGSSGSSVVLTCVGTHPSPDAQDVVLFVTN